MSSYVSSMSYRGFGLKQMSYSNGHTLSVQYDNRLRPTQWNIPGVMGWNYAYNYFNEKSGRVMYAQNINDGTLDRSYDYDHVGRLIASHSGVEARGEAAGDLRRRCPLMSRGRCKVVTGFFRVTCSDSFDGSTGGLIAQHYNRSAA